MQNYVVELASAIGNWRSTLLRPSGESYKMCQRTDDIEQPRKLVCSHLPMLKDGLRHHHPSASGYECISESPAILQSRKEARGI